jgi:two-component SAPR family response regulator
MEQRAATEQPQSSLGLRVFVLEDEALLSMLLEDVLAELGCSVVGPFARCDAALAFLEAGAPDVDFGILDVNVAGQRSDAVAEAFDRLSLPFVFSTGYDDAALGAQWRSKPNLRKPFRQADLERVLVEHARTR